MTNMIKSTLRFSIGLLLVIGVVFIIDIGLLYYKKLTIFENLISYTYFSNILLAILIFAVLFYLQKNHEHILGFVFMGGSFLKFAVFFIFFSPVFKQDGDLTRLETLSFMIPYIACLIYETTYVSKMLNAK